MPFQNSDQSKSQEHLAKALKALQEFEIGYLAQDLNIAIQHARVSVNAFAAGDERRAGALAILGVALQRRYQTSPRKDIHDVEEAVQVTKEALELRISGAHREDPQDYFDNLERVLVFLAKTSKHDRDVEKGMNTFQEIVDLTREGSPYRALGLKGLCNICSFGYAQTQQLVYLDRGKTAAQAALSIIPKGHPLKETMLGVLHDFFDDGFKKTKSLSDIDGMIQVSQELLALEAESSVTNPLMVLHNLATAFTNRFNVTADAKDMEEAVASRATAVKMAILKSPRGSVADRLVALKLAREQGRQQFLLQKDVLIVQLRDSLRTYLEVTGNIPEIDEDVLDVIRIISNFMPDGHQDPIEWQRRLGDAFQKRYEQNHRIADLEYAILSVTAAMQSTNETYEGWESLEDKYRERYRLWSEHTGKMPESEISMLIFGDNSYIPPEVDRNLELSVPYTYYLGDLPTE